jgi:hypothetical protein
LNERPLRQVGNDDGCCLASISGIREDTEAGEESCLACTIELISLRDLLENDEKLDECRASVRTRDKGHDPGKDSRELFGFLHGLGDGDDQADTLKGEDGRSDQERVLGRVEESDVCDPLAGENRGFVRSDIDDCRSNQ